MKVQGKIGVFGASGMAREVGDIIIATGYEPIYLARNESDLLSSTCPSMTILEKDIQKYDNIPFVIGIGESSVREKIAHRYNNQVEFTNVIHPSVTFGLHQREEIESRKGIIIAAGARLTNGIVIGDFCIINQNVTIAHDCLVGGYVHIASGANLSGNVYVHDHCWIGAGAVINQGSLDSKLEIGAHTTIGSGAVVISDCDSRAVYAGVPAKRLK